MKHTRRLIVTLAAIVFSLNAVGITVGLAVFRAGATPALAASANGAMTQQATDAPYDSRPCRQHPSAQTCNGVLPFAPHFSIFERAEGSGACFDDQRMLMEDQQITDAKNNSLETLQLWYFPACKVYTSHLIFGDASQGNTISTEVQQFDGSGIGNAITKFFWNFGDEDPLLPSATEQTGPVQDDEIWSPMLYSPDAPVQASATIDAASGMQYAPITGYYAGGHPTTINGKRS